MVRCARHRHRSHTFVYKIMNTPLIILGMFGWTEILIIALIILLLFGAKRIPQLMKGVGEGIGEFNKGRKNPDEQDNNAAPKA